MSHHEPRRTTNDQPAASPCPSAGHDQRPGYGTWWCGSCGSLRTEQLPWSTWEGLSTSANQNCVTNLMHQHYHTVTFLQYPQISGVPTNLCDVFVFQGPVFPFLWTVASRSQQLHLTICRMVYLDCWISGCGTSQIIDKVGRLRQYKYQHVVVGCIDA